MTLSDEGKNKLHLGIQTLGITPPGGAVDLLYRYLDMIEEWNTRINLTRILGDDAVSLHILDALSLTKAIPLETVESVADVGSGLGVPGIVLKIMFPQMRILLVDSLKKRVTFLEAVIAALGLSNASAIHARSEELGSNRLYREKFSLVTARAVADLKVLSELCLPLCEVGGQFASYKGDISAEEIDRAQSRLIELGGGEKVATVQVDVPYLDAKRSIVVIEKIQKTHSAFPRAFRLIDRD